MLRNVARFTEGMAEGPFEKNAAGWADLRGVVADDGDADGGDAGSFDFPLDQSYGLIADASGRGEQDQVDFVGAELAGDLAGTPFDQGRDVPAIDVPHEAKVPMVEAAEQSLGHKLLQALQR